MTTTTTTIKLGQCFMVRFAPNELPIRIEGNNPSGGWFSRALTHGHVVQVKNESQLLYKLTADESHNITRGVVPNRRLRIQGAVFNKPTVTTADEAVTNITLRKIKCMPF
jgi:hypothetical protein